MVVQRGEIWWADLNKTRGAEPGFRRPFVVVQDDAFNRSRIQTVVCVAITSNLRLGDAPGNVVISRSESGLPKDSVANISQIVTIDRAGLTERVGRLSTRTRERIDRGLRLVLAL
jgi:mRNA interferase MazF